MTKPHERLDKLIDERRLELRLRWRQVADDAGVSFETLRAVRRGTHQPSALTKTGIEETLQWLPGSVDKILAGGEPTPIPTEHEDESVLERLRRIEKMVREIVEDAEEDEHRRSRGA